MCSFPGFLHFEMPSRNSGELMLVHHDRTRTTEIRRSVEPIKSSRDHSKTLPTKFWCRDKGTLQKCSCQSIDRLDRRISVDTPIFKIAINLKRCLGRRQDDSSPIGALYVYHENDASSCRRSRVHVGNLHYTNRHKSTVCRCTDDNSNTKPVVRNSEIIELCKEFFEGNDKTTCSRDEWRRVRAARQQKKATKLSSGYQNRRSKQKVVSRSNQQIDTKEGLESQRVIEETLDELPEKGDIPEQVWKHARPALWQSRDDFETALSTPLGSCYFPRGLDDLEVSSRQDHSSGLTCRDFNAASVGVCEQLENLDTRCNSGYFFPCSATKLHKNNRKQKGSRFHPQGQEKIISLPNNQSVELPESTMAELPYFNGIIGLRNRSADCGPQAI